MSYLCFFVFCPTCIDRIYEQDDGFPMRQELPTFREHLSSPPVFGGVRIAHILSFLYVVSRDCSFFIALSVFSNVYLIIILKFLEMPNLNNKYILFLCFKKY